MNNDSRFIFEAYTLNGFAKGKTIEDIAKKHGVSVKDIETQIEKGIKVEHEHTKDSNTAKKIATDHVFEDPTYYDKLSKIEAKSENAEDMSKSPFHYDPMHGLASAANKIRDELRSAANDEARPEHIEKMAEIILGPQSEYASVDHYKKALSGVIELLNHYVMVEMN